MQLCAQCNHSSSDSAEFCVNCGSQLSEFSTTAQALTRMRAKDRITMVRVVVSHDACPACMSVEGTYLKEEVPILPVRDCSHLAGCRCFYEPVLEVIYP